MKIKLKIRINGDKQINKDKNEFENTHGHKKRIKR